MATIIDSLIVTLGLDSSGFSAGKSKVDKALKDTGNEADKAGAKLKKTGKDGSEGFESVAKSAVKFLAVIGGTMAVQRFAEQMIESSAALDRFSKNLGVSENTVSAWSNAAELAGGSAQGLQGTMDMLSRAQTELQLTGQSGLIPYFSALGISMSDANGNVRDVTEELLDMADRFSKMERKTAYNMGVGMGIDPGTMNLLLKGRSEVELMIKRQKEYGAVTKEQAESSSRLKLAMTDSRQSFEAFGRELLLTAGPALEKLFSIFQSFGNWCKENKEFISNFLTIIGVGLAGIAIATIPINLTATAVLGLAAAIAALWQDYQTWKRGGDSFIDWGKWEPGFKLASNAIRWLKDALGDIIYRAIAAADMLAAVFSGDWKRAKFAVGEFISGNGKKYGEEAPTPAGSTSSAAMAYFQAQGWSKEQAAGLAANISRESNFNPSAVGDNGKAYGIGQWHPDRQAEFKKRFGKNIQGSTFEEQMAFMQYELTQGNERKAGNILRGTTGAAEAAGVVSTHYERPADKAGEAAKRGQLALAMLGGIPGASQAASGAGAAQMALSKSGGGVQAGNRSVETNIGEIKVYTAATDATGIARDVGQSMEYLFTAQANYGMAN